MERKQKRKETLWSVPHICNLAYSTPSAPLSSCGLPVGWIPSGYSNRIGRQRHCRAGIRTLVAWVWTCTCSVYLLLSSPSQLDMTDGTIGGCPAAVALAYLSAFQRSSTIYIPIDSVPTTSFRLASVASLKAYGHLTNFVLTLARIAIIEAFQQEVLVIADH